MNKLLLIFLFIQLALAGTAKLTIAVNTNDDSQIVIGYKAVLYNANNVKIDSIISTSSNQVTFLNLTTEVKAEKSSQPILYEVQQNYPNPFNPSTKIMFSIPKSEEVDLSIFNILGQVIAHYNAFLNAGTHELEWQPDAAAGVYFYALKAGEFSQAKKMVLLDGVRGKNKLELIANSGNYSGNSKKSSEAEGMLSRLAKTAGANYSVKIINLPSTLPQILDTLIQIMNLENDTTINVYLSRYLKPAALNPVANVSFKEDRPPADSLLALLYGTGYDKNGNLVADSMNVYQVVVQTDTSLVKVFAEGNKVKLKELKQRGNGYSDITVRMTAPNGKYADRSFRVNVAAVQDLLANFTDYFRNVPLTDSIFVKTSIDSGYIAPGKTFLLSGNAENVEVFGPNILGRIFAIPAGAQDVTLNDFLANADTSKLGIDKAYFMDGALKRLNGPFPTNKTVAMTQESLKDTIWVYGNFEDVLPGLSLGFRTVEQLNIIAKLFNETAKELTTTRNYQNGLFGVDKQIIAIADSNFSSPDSIAKFAYSNMVVVPQSLAPLELNVRRNYFRVNAQNIPGGNGTYYKTDGLTIKGGVLLLPRYSNGKSFEIAAIDEAYSMFLGGVETTDHYPSIIEQAHNDLYPHDKRMMQYITFVGPNVTFLKR